MLPWLAEASAQPRSRSMLLLTFADPAVNAESSYRRLRLRFRADALGDGPAATGSGSAEDCGGS